MSKILSSNPPHWECIPSSSLLRHPSLIWLPYCIFGSVHRSAGTCWTATSFFSFVLGNLLKKTPPPQWRGANRKRTGSSNPQSHNLILNIHRCKTMSTTITFPMIIVSGIRNIRALAFRTLRTVWCSVRKVSPYLIKNLTHRMISFIWMEPLKKSKTGRSREPENGGGGIMHQSIQCVTNNAVQRFRGSSSISLDLAANSKPETAK